jgi:hypothetical protein
VRKIKEEVTQIKGAAISTRLGIKDSKTKSMKLNRNITN